MIALSLLGVITLTSIAQTDTIDYLGQTPPGNKAAKFAPDIISLTNRIEDNIAFTPDGNECYFTVSEYVNNGFTSKIYCKKLVNNTWTEHVEAPFSVNKNVVLSSLSVDGNKLYFETDNSIWKVERTEGGWGEPQRLPSTSGDHSYCETADGTVYFGSNRPDGLGKMLEIWRILPSSDQAENLGPVINSTLRNLTPCVAPDGSFIIFTQSNTMYEHLCISFNKGNNEWTKPLNMDRSGAGINSNNTLFQSRPSLSPDGKYLFYNSHVPYENISDIYWVSTSIIDTLKKIAMPTVSVKNTTVQNLNLFPNPTKGLFTMSFDSNPLKQATTEIYNTEGKLVFSEIFQNKTTATFDLTGFQAGMYVVKVFADGVSYEEKVLKE